MNRRAFLTNSIAAAGVSAVPLAARAVGANDKIRMGFIGVGNRGSQLLRLFRQHPEVDVAALCDVYEPYLKRDLSAVPEEMKRQLKDGHRIPNLDETFPHPPKQYKDYRALLDDKDIDAVCIATPDHWHAIMTIDAIRAGKDVYCEKPLTQTIAEGRAMVNAQKASKQVVGVGLNRRGNPAYLRLAKLLNGDGIGKITVGRALHVSDMYPEGIGKFPVSEPTPGLDWDMWLGPRAWRPFRANIAPYRFRWFSDFSSQMGNWGVHYIDVMRWMMGETAPCAITAVGGKYVLDDDSDIPDTVNVIFEFADGKSITYGDYEAAGGPSMLPYGEVELRGTKGTAYACERGYRILPNHPGQFQTWNPLIKEEKFDVVDKDTGDGSSSVSTGGLIGDFLSCVRTRKEPLCPLEEGHRSTSFAHLANIALKMRCRLEWDARAERFTNCEKANDYLSYAYRSPWKLA